jgi:hypothetical protein
MTQRNEAKLTAEQHRRLTLMGTSSVVGGDIRAALAEIERLRALLRVAHPHVEDKVLLGSDTRQTGRARGARGIVVSDIVERLREEAGEWLASESTGMATALMMREAADEIERLRARIAELEPLRAEVKEWLCTACRYVYPGPPQSGFQSVICPRCNGSTGPRAMMELRAANERIAELEKQLAHAKVWDRDVPEPKPSSP